MEIKDGSGRFPALSMCLAVLVFVCVMATAHTAKSDEKIGSVFSKLAKPFPAPDIAFKDTNGKPVGFIEFRGKVVVLYVWATWCPICAIDMPDLDRLQGKLNSKYTAVIPLSIDRGDIRFLHSFYKKKGIRFLQVYQDQDSILAAVLGIRGTPTAFLIDRSGIVIGVSEGATDWNASGVLRSLKKLSRPEK